MEKREFKNNIKLSLIAFIAATLLLSACNKSETKNQEESGQLSMAEEVEVEETENNGELTSEQIQAIIDETNKQLREDKNLKTKEKQALDSEEQKLIKELLEIHPDFSVKEVKETILGLRRNKAYYTKNVLPELKKKLAEREQLKASGELKVPTGAVDVQESEGKILEVSRPITVKWQFDVSGNNATLVNCGDNTMTNFNYDLLKIGSDAKLYRISRVGNNAFSKKIKLKSFSSKFVTEIGSYAFEGCKNLESVKVSDVVTEIAQGAFNGCEKLTGFNDNGIIVVSSALFNKQSAGIGQNAFGGCVSAKKLYVDLTKDMDKEEKYKNNLKKAHKQAFNGCKFDVVNFSVLKGGVSSNLGNLILSYFGFDEGTKLEAIEVKPTSVEIDYDAVNSAIDDDTE